MLKIIETSKKLECGKGSYWGATVDRSLCDVKVWESSTCSEFCQAVGLLVLVFVTNQKFSNYYRSDLCVCANLVQLFAIEEGPTEFYVKRIKSVVQ